MGARWRGWETQNHSLLFAYCHRVDVGLRAATPNEEDVMSEGGGRVTKSVEHSEAEGLQRWLTYGFVKN